MRRDECLGDSRRIFTIGDRDLPEGSVGSSHYRASGHWLRRSASLWRGGASHFRGGGATRGVFRADECDQVCFVEPLYLDPVAKTPILTDVTTVQGSVGPAYPPIPPP